MAAQSIEPQSIKAQLLWAASQLADSDSPRLDAELLLAHCLVKPRTYLFTWPERVLEAEQVAAFKRLIERRAAGEPVAYLLGQQEFWSLPLRVSKATLIPRPETELLVELALAKSLASDARVLDLGTGTGAIALALASEQPRWRVAGLDVNPKAINLAVENGQALGLSRVKFQQSDWFSAVAADERFQLIVSNPPYIRPDDPHLSQGDVRFEPATALVAEDNGMADIITIATQARNHLAPGGWLLFEHGYDQEGASCQLLRELGYQQVECFRDLAGQPRVTQGQMPV